jgi:NAD(P)H-nitrite reductase large subunit
LDFLLPLLISVLSFVILTFRPISFLHYFVFTALLVNNFTDPVPHHLIIGFCAAGANAAEAIRRLDPTAEITVLNGDTRFFYLRLDLEGVFEEKPLERIQPRPPEFWQQKNIRVINARALHVDSNAKVVTAQGGTKYAYDKLLIATGAHPRKLNVPGETLPGIFTYHSLEDAQRIYSYKTFVKHCVIIGAGILGLEFARCAHEWFHWDVTVLVRGDFLGSGTVDAAGGAYILRSMQKAGVNVLFNESVAEFQADDEGHLARIVTKSGKLLETDFAAKCVGIEPAISFLQDTPVLTEGQLIVNEFLETPARDIFAAGDVATVRTRDGHLVRCNTWNVALDQARLAAKNMVGQELEYAEDVLYNLDALFDLPLAVIGSWDRRHSPGYELHDLSTDTIHRQVITKAGVLIGGALLGDRTGDRRLRKLASLKANVANKLDRLFAPDAKPEEFL